MFLFCQPPGYFSPWRQTAANIVILFERPKQFLIVRNYLLNLVKIELKFRKCETPLMEPARAMVSPFPEGRNLG